jgi:deazaflavin-dependent oxidoreductase (nitroreductase family)
MARTPEMARHEPTALQRIAEYESTVRPGPLTWMLRVMGRWRAFSWFYRRVGPRIDPWLMKRWQGRLVARVYGVPVLLLGTRGAKTGLPRSTPLLYLRDGDDFLVVGTNFGQAHHPAWTGNLLASPEGSVEVAATRVEVTAELVDEQTFGAHFPRFVEVYPGYALYIERSGRSPRMFRLRPKLTGAER